MCILWGKTQCLGTSSTQVVCNLWQSPCSCIMIRLDSKRCGPCETSGLTLPVASLLLTLPQAVARFRITCCLLMHGPAHAKICCAAPPRGGQYLLMHLSHDMHTYIHMSHDYAVHAPHSLVKRSMLQNACRNRQLSSHQCGNRRLLRAALTEKVHLDLPPMRHCMYIQKDGSR